MSYDIQIIDPETNKVIETSKPHYIQGGTYALGENYRLELNITYNYAEFFREQFGDDGIRWLYGKTVKETIHPLVDAVTNMHANETLDYWTPTEGNARRALLQLIELAFMAPLDAVWRGD